MLDSGIVHIHYDDNWRICHGYVFGHIFPPDMYNVDCRFFRSYRLFDSNKEIS